MLMLKVLQTMRALMRKLKTLKVIENRYELPQLCLRFFYGFIRRKGFRRRQEFYIELFDAQVLVDVGRLAMIGKSMSEPKISVCIP